MSEQTRHEIKMHILNKYLNKTSIGNIQSSIATFFVFISLFKLEKALNVAVIHAKKPKNFPVHTNFEEGSLKYLFVSVPRVCLSNMEAAETPATTKCKQIFEAFQKNMLKYKYNCTLMQFNFLKQNEREKKTLTKAKKNVN